MVDSGSRPRPTRRLLFVVPHFYAPDAGDGVGGPQLAPQRTNKKARLAGVVRCISALHETFGSAMRVAPTTRQQVTPANTVDVVLVTTGEQHLVSELEPIRPLFEQVETDAKADELGFVAHHVLAERAGRYDYYCLFEDDFVIHDGLFFEKLAAFTNSFGNDALLQPNRYEASGGHKVYFDGPLVPEVMASIQQPDGPQELSSCWLGMPVTFERPSNPHAGGFFVNAKQFERLRAWPGFGIPGAEFVRTIETWATYAIVSVFCVYKPASPSADLLEFEHRGTRYLDHMGLPEPAHVATAARMAADARLQDVEAECRQMRSSTSWRVTRPLRALGRATGRRSKA
jgi:hypothetical protein